MGYRELFVSQSNVFSGFQKSFEEADYVILGVPFDATSTIGLERGLGLTP
jgi:hypothetical protein